MNPKTLMRIAKLAVDYAQAYAEGKDAPEGRNGAYELQTLALALAIVLKNKELSAPMFGNESPENPTA